MKYSKGVNNFQEQKQCGGAVCRGAPSWPPVKNELGKQSGSGLKVGAFGRL
jgi:hypothetical protein